MRFPGSVVAILALLTLFTACDSDMTTPSSVTQSIDLTGTWVGDFAVIGQPASMTWELTQTSKSVTGPVTVALLNGVVVVNGSLAGTLSASTLTYTITIDAGGIPSQPNCTGQLDGTVTAKTGATTTLAGSYNVTSSSCPSTFPGGSFTLTKQ